MKTKILCCCIAVTLLCAEVYALPPLWLKTLPGRSETYYYRRNFAEADTEEKAYTKALIKVACESAIAADFPVDLQQLLQMPEDSILVSLSRYSNIPVNVVCQYTEKLVSKNGYRVYLLCQVASKAGTKPKYRDFDCDKSKEQD